MSRASAIPPAFETVMRLAESGRKPRSWWLPLTYPPKIRGVCDGTIGQTLRPGLKYIVGDRVAFHGWEGRPYRSKWSFRTDYFTLTEVIPVCLFSDSMAFLNLNPERLFGWSCPEIDEIARLDGIDPPTGEALAELLNSMYKLSWEKGIPFQIIRWRSHA